jgi:hypothetical protein
VIRRLCMGGVELQKKEANKKNRIKTMLMEQPLERRHTQERSLPIEADNEIEFIDLSNLTGITSKDDAELSELNRRILIKHPIKWEINSSGGSRKIYQDGSIELNERGTSEYHEIYPKCDTQRHDICSSFRAPPYKTITGACIKPTQINSLLSQNLDGKTTRPPSNFFWWDQTDEGYYKAVAKEGLPELIAATRENYYNIPETSKHRLKFRCPHMGKSDREHGRLGDSDLDIDDAILRDDYDGYFRQQFLHWQTGDILIHVNPENDQAVFYCPKCSRAEGKAIKHAVPRKLRDALAADGIIPFKEYKYKDRLAEADEILKLVHETPGISYYGLDKEMGWPKGTAERVINKHLKDKVRVRKAKKPKKGYGVYPN